MIKIENTAINGWEAAIRGMRNPLNSWDNGDSCVCRRIGIEEECSGMPHGYCQRDELEIDDGSDFFCIGKNDHDLMMRLVGAGTDHSKFMRYIVASCDAIAPLYWWKEARTYRIGVEMNSCSTMHRIHSKPLFRSDFSCEHLERSSLDVLDHVIAQINDARDDFLASQKENDVDSARNYWWQMIQLLPSSYNQRRTLQLNYQALRNIYHARRNHKLDEWRDFCRWIESLPYSELITQGK